MTTLINAMATADPGAGRSVFDVLMEWAKVDTTWQLMLIVFGLGAQSLFFGRWLVQWIATERRGESHVPILFWWMSLAGATLLFTYFLLRGEPVGMLGQSVGWAVYTRNLYLIRKKGRPEPSPKCPKCGHDWTG
jgi:lipid-A-disaccharide synthase-like uncharacterized protein